MIWTCDPVVKSGDGSGQVSLGGGFDVFESHQAPFIANRLAGGPSGVEFSANPILNGTLKIAATFEVDWDYTLHDGDEADYVLTITMTAVTACTLGWGPDSKWGGACSVAFYFPGVLEVQPSIYSRLPETLAANESVSLTIRGTVQRPS
jgi:hypothetical protein